MMDTAALADVAKSNDMLEATTADMEKVGKLFSDPAVMGFFMNPTVEVEKKRKLIDEVAESEKLQPHMVNFLNIVVDMKWKELIGHIAKEFEACYNRMTGTQVAVVTSVVELESAQLEQIAQDIKRLTGAKNIRIRTALDPSLIDLSVRKQLDEIARQLEINVDLVGAPV